jgi:hypothetical protein
VGEGGEDNDADEGTDVPHSGILLQSAA